MGSYWNWKKEKEGKEDYKGGQRKKRRRNGEAEQEEERGMGRKKGE